MQRVHGVHNFACSRKITHWRAAVAFRRRYPGYLTRISGFRGQESWVRNSGSGIVGPEFAATPKNLQKTLDNIPGIWYDGVSLSTEEGNEVLYARAGEGGHFGLRVRLRLLHGLLPWHGASHAHGRSGPPQALAHRAPVGGMRRQRCATLRPSQGRNPKHRGGAPRTRSAALTLNGG